MTKRKILGIIILFITAMIWGVAFLFQDALSGILDPFTINTIRNLTAGTILLVVSLVKNKVTKAPKTNVLKELAAGVPCGLFLAVGMNLQQFAISLYPENLNISGRASFITALYVILVPIFERIILKKTIKINAWIATGLAVVGVYFLCFTGGIEGAYFADFIGLTCAAGFAFQILFSGLADSIDAVRLMSIEFLTAGAVSFVLMIIFEKPTLEGIKEGILPLMFLALGSSLIGFTFQIIGTRLLESPAVAAVIMSLESVFATLSGAIIMSKLLSTNELIGCTIMFSAIIIANITFKKVEKPAKSN